MFFAAELAITIAHMITFLQQFFGFPAHGRFDRVMAVAVPDGSPGYQQCRMRRMETVGDFTSHQSSLGMLGEGMHS